MSELAKQRLGRIIAEISQWDGDYTPADIPAMMHVILMDATDALADLAATAPRSCAHREALLEVAKWAAVGVVHPNDVKGALKDADAAASPCVSARERQLEEQVARLEDELCEYRADAKEVHDRVLGLRAVLERERQLEEALRKTGLTETNDDNGVRGLCWCPDRHELGLCAHFAASDREPACEKARALLTPAAPMPTDAEGKE